VIDLTQVHEGMVVRDSNGKKLGRVLSRTQGGFVIEKGFFLVTDYATRYDDVAGIAGDTIQLSRPREELAHGALQPPTGDPHGVAWPSYGDEGGGGWENDT
jgi:hypothetical protein